MKIIQQLAYMFHSVCDIWMSLDGQVWIGMGKRALDRLSISWWIPWKKMPRVKKQKAKL